MTQTNQSLNDLLTDMRRQVEYSDKITMSIPLYERMKAVIAVMGVSELSSSTDKTVGSATRKDAGAETPATHTLIGLLPCPWCGSSAKLSPPEPVTAPHKDWWTVVCSNPECQMDSAYAGNSSQECIQVWNTRVSVDQMNANHHRESVRCMSKVFNDLAHELGISKEKYGDPELLFDAISTLKEKHAYSEIPVNDTTKERCVADDQWAIDAFYEGYERANADFKANGFSGLKPIIGGIRSLLATVNTTKRESVDDSHKKGAREGWIRACVFYKDMDAEDTNSEYSAEMNKRWPII